MHPLETAVLSVTTFWSFLREFSPLEVCGGIRHFLMPRSRVLKGHTHWIWSVAFSPDGRWLVTGSFDDTTRLWDLKSKNPARMVNLLCAVKAGDFQWVQIPPGDGPLQPEAVGATEEVTNPSKPLM